MSHAPYDNKTESFHFAIWQSCTFGLTFVLGLVFTILLFGSSFSAGGLPFSKFFFWFFFTALMGGFMIFGLKMWENWDEKFTNIMKGKYYSLDRNKNICFELLIPEDHDYPGGNLVGFAFFFKNSFRSVNVDRSNLYMEGKWHSNLAFDFIIEKGKIRTFMRFPKKKYSQMVEGFTRFFPDVRFTPCEDPYKNYPEWSENMVIDGYDSHCGFNFGFQVHAAEPLDVAPPTTGRGPFDLMLRYLRDNLKNERTHVQYVFRSNKDCAHDFPDVFAKHRQKIFDRYAPKGVGGEDFSKGHPQGLEVMVPKSEIEFMQAYNDKALGHPKAQTSLKFFSLCKKNDLGFTENTLDKAARVFYGNTSLQDQGMEKKYITSTDQRYFHLNNYQPEAQPIYDCYWFPHSLPLEMFLEPLYETYYYPNENRYRRYTLYNTILKRDINASWNGDITLNSTVDFSVIFQIPSFTSMGSGLLTESLLQGTGVRDHTGVFNAHQRIDDNHSIM
jgi:hypothetical protein